MLALFLSLAGTLVYAGCDGTGRPQSTPEERYEFLGNGTVFDKKTKLTWMRCAVGQKWDGSTCTGTATLYSWNEIRNESSEFNFQEFAGYSDWRVPKIPELASIVELTCTYPRVNQRVFPKTPSLLFWSSMEKTGAPSYAYSLNFGRGEVAATQKSTRAALRLVRGGPWWITPELRESALSEPP